MIQQESITNHQPIHGSKSRSRSPTRPAPRRIGLGDSGRTRTIHAKSYIERQKNYEKIMTNRKKM